MPLIGKLHIDHPVANVLFTSENSHNKEGIFDPIIRLKLALHSHNISLSTNPKGEIADFDIYLDCYPKTLFSRPSFLIAMECPIFTPEIYDPSYTVLFSKIFSWNQKLKSLPNNINITHPSNITPEHFNSFNNRDIFCCLINANKISLNNNPSDLYQKREEIIRWYEKNKSADFHLYGRGWDKPKPAKNAIDRVFRRNLTRLRTKLFSYTPYPSYKGELSKKSTALSNTKFCFCYENIYGLEGYITEKIFDAMRYGTVPIYLGAPNITDYIPKDCFIDARDFTNISALNDFLHSISETEFDLYQKHIQNFLVSNKAFIFSPEHFATTITKHILTELAKS